MSQPEAPGGYIGLLPGEEQRGHSASETGLPENLRSFSRTRRLWVQGKHSQLSGRRLYAAAQAALYRDPRQESLRSTPDYVHSLAAGHSHQGAEWPRSVPLLCPVWSRMQNRLEFQL